MAWCLFVLLHDPSFDQASFWKAAPFARYLPEILVEFGITAAVGVVLVLRFGAPGLFLNLPRANPRLWSVLMILYPVLSVYPQGIIYRAFIFARYRDLFTAPWAMVAASAFAFTYVHIVFRNRLALVLTAMGGILFGIRYLQTGSLLVTSFEHSLYGCFMFTVGVGRSFHHGSIHDGSGRGARTGGPSFAGSIP